MGSLDWVSRCGLSVLEEGDGGGGRPIMTHPLLLTYRRSRSVGRSAEVINKLSAAPAATAAALRPFPVIPARSDYRPAHRERTEMGAVPPTAPPALSATALSLGTRREQVL